MSHIYGHSHSMGTSINVVIQEIAKKSGLLLIVYIATNQKYHTNNNYTSLHFAEVL